MLLAPFLEVVVPRFSSTLLATIAEKKDPKDIEQEIRKADLDLLAKINEVAGDVQPVPGEPSLGTAHPVADGNKTNVLVVSSAVNTANVWSAAVTLTKAPAGAKMGYCNFYFTLAGTMTRLGVARASGETLYNISGNPPWLNMILGRNQSNGSVCEGMGWIPIDSNKQFKWCCADSNVTVRISDATYYWC
jgi:hypothetical protein